MKVQEIKEIAKKMGLGAGNLRKAELVRAIQKAEGNAECFGDGNAAGCGQQACLWREDCQ